MFVRICRDDPLPGAGVDCVDSAWVELPTGFFYGWTVDDLAALAVALGGLWAVLLILRVVHRWALSDLNL